MVSEGRPVAAEKGRTLYHYCSNATFTSIIESKSIRLSLLTLSNDTKEGQHVRDVMEGLIPERLNPNC